MGWFDSPVVCETCGMKFYVPTRWLEAKTRRREFLWCPNGHKGTIVR